MEVLCLSLVFKFFLLAVSVFHETSSSALPFKKQQIKTDFDFSFTESESKTPLWLQHEKKSVYFPITKKQNRQLKEFAEKSEYGVQLGGGLYINGGYSASLLVGTPPKSFRLQIDTGSDLLWIPCDCTDCAHTLLYGEASPPFDSLSSSSSLSPLCTQTLCRFFSEENPLQLGCHILGKKSMSILTQNKSAIELIPFSDFNDLCQYLFFYGDGSSSGGKILIDKIYFGEIKARVAFGCGQIQSGNTLYRSSFDGVLGLGRKKFSIISQLEKQKVLSLHSFSLCLEGDSGGGHLLLGRSSLSQGGIYTKLHGSPSDTYFQILVKSLTFGSVDFLSSSVLPRVSLPLVAALDSGSTVTSLPRGVYEWMREEVMRLAGNPEVFLGPLGLSCFNLSRGATSNENLVRLFPPLSLSTEDDKIWTFPPFNFLASQSLDFDSTVCLASLPSPRPFLVLGDSWLQNFDLLFDHTNSRVGWRPLNCSTGEDLKIGESVFSFPRDEKKTDYETDVSKDSDKKERSSPSPSLPSLSPPPPLSPLPPPLSHVTSQNWKPLKIPFLSKKTKIFISPYTPWVCTVGFIPFGIVVVLWRNRRKHLLSSSSRRLGIWGQIKRGK